MNNHNYIIVVTMLLACSSFAGQDAACDESGDPVLEPAIVDCFYFSTFTTGDQSPEDPSCLFSEETDKGPMGSERSSWGRIKYLYADGRSLRKFP